MRLVAAVTVRLVRLVWRVITIAIAGGFWAMRITYHLALVGRGVLRLASRQGPGGAIACSSCGEAIGPEAALECSVCRFRWWGSIWAPCPGPECTARSTSWILCPHCNYSTTNPYLVGRELPE